MKIKDLLQDASIKLKDASIANSAMEARILLKFTLGVSEEFLLLNGEQEIGREKEELFKGFVERRLKLEPIAYILGYREFYGRDFIVTKDTLIPRPDSEILIDSVLSDYRSKDNLQILELGVGSGCLIITLLLELNRSSGVAVDISEKALEVARQNAYRHGARDINFVLSDWFSDLGQKKFDVIIANPPYIDCDSLEVTKETAIYEPHLALFADEKGLAVYREIATKARGFLISGGSIYLEIGYNQEISVKDLFFKEGYILLKSYRDLAGHVRCLHFKL